PADLASFGTVVEATGNTVVLRVERADTAATTARLMANFDVADLTVADPPIEDLIARLFTAGTP
ncbi:MAG TPA: hypothetical protein PLV68_19745, partial [Ilumatobacteraceae bacterium]|nr:hypothetical protein [Ilumatobacteraceae bacterium]